MQSSRATVDTTANGTAILANASGKPYTGSIRNRGSVAVYLGASGLTTSTGYQLDPGEAVGLQLRNGGTLYGITASSSVAVHVLYGNLA